MFQTVGRGHGPDMAEVATWPAADLQRFDGELRQFLADGLSRRAAALKAFYTVRRDRQGLPR